MSKRKQFEEIPFDPSAQTPVSPEALALRLLAERVALGDLTAQITLDALKGVSPQPFVEV